MGTYAAGTDVPADDPWAVRDDPTDTPPFLDPSTTQERNHPMNHDETNGIMNDRSFDESFRAFQKRVGEINAANGWRTSPPDGATAERQIAVLALITTELADVVIRAADFADHYGINLAAAIEEKLAYNATRGHRHGGKAI